MKPIHRDLLACGAPDTSLKTFLYHFFTHPGFKAILYYRLYSKWYKQGKIKKVLGKYLWLRNTKNTGCQISPHAVIGPGLHLPHATGIVIGIGSTIGENTTIWGKVSIAVV